ncbi:MAG: DUF4157 domain-containing protein [Candidatus Korobacteraceae bacterium]
MNFAIQSRDKAAAASRTRGAWSPPGNRLSVGAHADSYEHEADRAARDVMSGHATRAGWSLSSIGIQAPVQRKCACGPGKSPGECEECKKKEHPVQRKAVDAETPAEIPAVVYEVLDSPGMPLGRDTRRFFEPRFGADFSRIRIHHDERASRSARAVNAHAYTVGHHIAFAAGKYAPETTDGRTLLAHELAHTIQQQGVQARKPDISAEKNPGYRRLEREASAAAGAVASNRPAVLVHLASRPTLSRADEENTDPATVKPAPNTKPVPGVGSSMGKHTVTPAEVLSKTGKDEKGKDTILSEEEFQVDPFYLPAEKGPAAFDVYDKMKGQALEAVIEMKGTGRTKTALWQLRPPTDDLQALWLKKVGWTKQSANDLWERCGGDKTFPKIATKTCEMDHIVELQIGGTNPPENIQPLDKTPNQNSGRLIRQELESLAKAIIADKSLSSGTAQQLKFRFTAVKQVGAPAKLSSKCPPALPRTCLDLERCAKELKVETTPAGTVTVAHADYAITAGGRTPSKLKVPITYATTIAETVGIEGDALNDPTSTLIPGLLLTNLAHVKGKTKPDVIQARIDTREKTRLPISLDKSAKPFRLNVNQIAGADGQSVGDLKLDPADKKGGVAFTYKYLSPGKITEIGVGDDGETTWKGTITPKIPFIGPLDVEYAKGALKVYKGLDEEVLKKKSFLGMQITKAQVSLLLAPDFKPEGTLEAKVGTGATPLATASIKVGTDAVGLVADGKLKLNIPKLQTAESDISYKGGGGRDEWASEIHVKSDAIKIPSVTVDGQFDGKIDKDGFNFTGQITATFPGESVAKLGLQKKGEHWILFGSGTFHVGAPKLDPTNVSVTYDLTDDKLVATGHTGFKIPSIGLGGKLEHITVELGKDLSFKDAKIYGKGSMEINKGKASGHATVNLLPTGKFSGEGSLTYELKPGLTVTGTVILDEQEKLSVKGTLQVARYELFKQHGDKRDLLNIDIPIPTPLSIGTQAGIVVHIRGGIGVAYSFGPGVIEPLIFSAGFDPLASDPNLELTVTGTVKVPASATLSASISGTVALQVDVAIASAGAEAGLKLTGELILSAGAFAKLDAAYKAKKLTAKVEAGIETSLMLGIALTAFARAWAGAFGFSGELRKDWVLGKKTIDTGVGFTLSAPFLYDSETGIKLPEAKDITLKKPELDFGKIVKQLFADAPPPAEHKT